MQSQRGFSLVEVLIALLILTIVITTSLAVFVERNKRLQQAADTILAYQVLANESEYWRRFTYTQLDTEEKTFKSGTQLLDPLKPFGTSVAVTETQPGIKNVMLTIRWKNGQREARLGVLRVDTGGSPLW